MMKLLAIVICLAVSAYASNGVIHAVACLGMYGELGMYGGPGMYDSQEMYGLGMYGMPGMYGAGMYNLGMPMYRMGMYRYPRLGMYGMGMYNPLMMGGLGMLGKMRAVPNHSHARFNNGVNLRGSQKKRETE